jgi:hypothetical protein
MRKLLLAISESSVPRPAFRVPRLSQGKVLAEMETLSQHWEHNAPQFTAVAQ